MDQKCRELDGGARSDRWCQRRLSRAGHMDRRAETPQDGGAARISIDWPLTAHRHLTARAATRRDPVGLLCEPIGC